MFYPIFKSIWLPRRLTRTRVMPGVSLPLVTLGNLHNLEIIEHPLVSTEGKPATVEDLARLLVVASRNWRASRWLIAHPHLLAFFSAIMVKKIGNNAEAVAAKVYAWFEEQSDFPARYISEEERNRKPNPSGHEFGSTPTLRLMLQVEKSVGWRAVTGLSDIRDLPRATAYALLIADNENHGSHYVSRDTETKIERLRNG